MRKPTLRFSLIRHAELKEKQILIITVSCEVSEENNVYECGKKVLDNLVSYYCCF